MDLWKRISEHPVAAEARRLGLYAYFLAFDANEGPEAVLEGRRVLMLGSNNYLGLTTHPRVREAARAAVDRWGTSMTGSRFVNGTLRIHEELEERLAVFLGTEAALVFTTGYQVNLAAGAALLGESTVAVLDREVHASLYDGARLGMSAGARMVRFGSNSPASLERHLSRLEPEECALVLLDGVFSTDGGLARLDALVPVARAHGARVLVDDAHGLGVVGPSGRGTAHHFGVEAQVDLLGGTFSKSLASVGGYLAGDAAVLDFVRHNAPSFMFAASGAPSAVAAAMEALAVLQEEGWRVERVRSNAANLADSLRALGFDVAPTESAIVAVRIGDDMRTLAVWRDLLVEHGVYTNPFVSPGVAPGRALIRASCMASHDQPHLDRAVEAFARVGRKHGVVP